MMSSTMKGQIYIELFTCLQETWLASRCVQLGSNNAFYEIFYIDNNIVDASWVYYSTDLAYRHSYAIRPIVEIDLTKVNVGVTGTGADGDGYSLTLK